MQCRELCDLKGRGPWAVASKCSENATKGPRPLVPYAACLDLRAENSLDYEI